MQNRIWASRHRIILGILVCAAVGGLSFAIIATIGQILWFELVPPPLPIYIDIIYINEPFRRGALSGLLYGITFGSFWALFDLRVTNFIWNLFRNAGWYKVLMRGFLLLLAGSILIGLIGTVLTFSLWQI